MASVTLRRLSKSFDRSSPPALQDLTLEVRDGEFLVLLGPSGCGKTTALRCIAGLDEPTAGQILIGERDVTHVGPAARDVAMVFQNYALYPHLTARENIAFALEMRRGAKAQIAQRGATAAGPPGLPALPSPPPAPPPGGPPPAGAPGRAPRRGAPVLLVRAPPSHP